MYGVKVSVKSFAIVTSEETAPNDNKTTPYNNVDTSTLNTGTLSYSSRGIEWVVDVVQGV